MQYSRAQHVTTLTTSLRFIQSVLSRYESHKLQPIITTDTWMALNVPDVSEVLVFSFPLDLFEHTSSVNVFQVCVLADSIGAGMSRAS